MSDEKTVPQESRSGDPDGVAGAGGVNVLDEAKERCAVTASFAIERTAE